MNSTKNEIDYIYNIRNNLTLLNIVQYHSVSGLYPSTSLTDGLILTALDSFDHLVHVSGADIMIDTATLYVKVSTRECSQHCGGCLVGPSRGGACFKVAPPCACPVSCPSVHLPRPVSRRT
jgi:hypothetical protein